MGRLFGTDGVRGIANEELTCERAMQIGRAAAEVLSSGRRYYPTVLVGMDTRISSEMLASALTAALDEIGYTGYLTIEREGSSTHDADVEKEVPFLKALIAE